MLLLDERYGRPSLPARLPSWIGAQFGVTAGTADAVARVRSVCFSPLCDFYAAATRVRR